MDGTSKPAYVSYVTFRNFVDLIKADGVPPRIDGSLMRNLSGSAQSQLKTALRYVQMTDDDDKPTQNFYDYADASNDEMRTAVLRRILESSYAFLFGSQSDGFDLSVATTQQFAEKFRDTGLNGDTLRKAQSFFINMANDAGVPLSKRITVGYTVGEKPRKPAQRKPKSETNKAKSEEDDEVPQPAPSPAQPQSETWRNAYIQMMKDKLPQFDPNWSAEVQKTWLDVLGGTAEILKESESDENNGGTGN